MAKITELRAMKAGDMKKELEKSHEELLNVRFKLATKQLVNHREVLQLKRKIAQLNTLLTEKGTETK